MTTTDSRNDQRANARPHGLQDAIPLDAAFDALAIEQCRALPAHLAADEVAVAECDRVFPEIDADAVLQLYLSLYHTHVPKLADAGLVEYGQARDFVTVTDEGRALESVVPAIGDAVEA